MRTYRQYPDFSISIRARLEMRLRQSDQGFVEIDPVFVDVDTFLVTVPIEASEPNRLNHAHTALPRVEDHRTSCASLYIHLELRRCNL